MKKSDRPYFITWANQREAITLPLEYSDNDFFYSKNEKWLNLSSISYQASFGMNNKHILNSMKRQMNSFSMASPKQIFELKENVSEELILKSTLKGFKCFYTQSGSEGVENSLKIVRQVSGKDIVLSLKNSYHGASLGALGMTGDWRRNNHYLPKGNHKFIPDPQKDPEGQALIAFFEKLNTKNIAAVILETFSGGNGVFTPSLKWWKVLTKILKEKEIFLILDEVVCAGHRTGPFFGFEHYKGLKPDIVITAKAMTGGYFPLGCLLISPKISKFYNHNILSCGLTNYAHPLGLAALDAVLNLTKNVNFQERLKKNIQVLTDFIGTDFPKSKIIGKRTVGMLAALDLSPNSLKQTDIYEAGIYAPIQNNRIILAPPLNISPTLLKSGLSKIEGLIFGN